MICKHFSSCLPIVWRRLSGWVKGGEGPLLQRRRSVKSIIPKPIKNKVCQSFVTIAFCCIDVVLSGTRFCRFWRKRCFFHEFLWFWQFFTNFSYSSSFAVILCMSVTNLSLALRFSSPQNYGKWWRIGEICEKLSKSKKFVKKHLFRQNRQNLSPQQSNKLLIVISIPNCNKYSNLVCNGKYWLKTAKSGSDIW